MTWNVHKYLQNRRFLRHGNINFRKLARRWFPPAVWLLDVWSNIKQHLNEPVRENGKRMNPFIEVFQKGRSMHCFCLRLDGLNITSCAFVSLCVESYCVPVSPCPALLCSSCFEPCILICTLLLVYISFYLSCLIFCILHFTDFGWFIFFSFFCLSCNNEGSITAEHKISGLWHFGSPFLHYFKLARIQFLCILPQFQPDVQFISTKLALSSLWDKVRRLQTFEI